MIHVYIRSKFCIDESSREVTWDTPDTPDTSVVLVLDDDLIG